MADPSYVRGRYVITARKAFACCWCGAIYETGEEYVLMAAYTVPAEVRERGPELVNGQVRICLGCWMGD